MSTLRLGLVADMQYADRDAAGPRRYREAAAKLAAALDDCNARPLDAVINLGDVIDGPPEQADQHLKVIFDVFARCRAPVVHVVGNHCLEGGRAAFDRHTPLRCYHHELALGDFRLIVLNGNDLSVRDYPEGDARLAEARAWLARGKTPWGGGIGAAQLAWFDATLADAARRGQRALVLSHIPLYEPATRRLHDLWNAPEVLDVLHRHGHVVACFAGHDHAGGCAADPHGVHHITFTSICEAPADGNAYAFVTITDTRLTIDGRGVEPSRELELRPTGAS